MDFFDQLGAWLFRVLVVEAIDAGEDHQMVRLDHLGDFCGEAVIVAHTDFFGRDRVIFVHDWQNIALQQAVNSVLGVQETLALFHVLKGNEHLCDIESKIMGNLFVGVQQQGHATRSSGLFVAQPGGFRLLVQHVQTERHGT